MATEREDELLRLNAELAAEIRRLGSGEIAGARSEQAPTARRLSRLLAECDRLHVESEELRGERDRLRAQLEQQVQRSQALADGLGEAERRNAELAHEVERLRSGTLGLVRRAWARLWRRR